MKDTELNDIILNKSDGTSVNFSDEYTYHSDINKYIHISEENSLSQINQVDYILNKLPDLLQYEKLKTLTSLDLHFRGIYEIFLRNKENIESINYRATCRLPKKWII